jgi:hypothetical protein
MRACAPHTRRVSIARATRLDTRSGPRRHLAPEEVSASVSSRVLLPLEGVAPRVVPHPCARRRGGPSLDGVETMTLSDWSWESHRLAVDRLGWQRPFGRRSSQRRMLFISERSPICHTQVFPFWHHRADLARRYGSEFRELSLARFLAGRNRYREVDAVCFQTWFDYTPEAIRGLAERIRIDFPGARLAYLDWFAPTDLRYAEALEPYIAAYVKKQVLRDRGQYGAVTLGDTNLTDFYARRFDLEGYPPTRFTVPPSIFDKLCLGTHFAFSPHMLAYFRREFQKQPRDIDIHLRIAIQGEPWYTCMRQEALDRARGLEERMNVVWRGRIPRDEYVRELFRSKMCFSPFGYGEVCWRDFEAIFAGSLLLKPDMSHLDCYPEAFLPYETYIPLAWDLHDFEEKIEYYLHHADEREAIARRAFELLQEYFRLNRFVDDVAPLFDRLGLRRAEDQPAGPATATEGT